MKKYFFALGLIALVLMSLTSPAWAEDDAFTKLGRGTANIFTSLGEFYMQPLLLSEDHSAGTAFFGGLVKGAAMFVAREVVGVYELATFPLPNPKTGYGPIIKPETAFSEWNNRQPINA